MRLFNSSNFKVGILTSVLSPFRQQQDTHTLFLLALLNAVVDLMNPYSAPRRIAGLFAFSIVASVEFPGFTRGWTVMDL